MSEENATDAVGEGLGTTLTVERVVPHPVPDVWKVLLTDDGTEALLGPGGKLGDKGHTWQANDGTHGVTRSFHPMEQIRFSWHRDEDAPATIVDLHLVPEGETTKLQLIHDHLDESADREWLTRHWTDALARIEADAL